MPVDGIDFPCSLVTGVCGNTYLGGSCPEKQGTHVG